MRDGFRRVVAALLAVALVSSAGVSPVGTAAAADGSNCAQDALEAGVDSNFGPMPNYYAVIKEGASCLWGGSADDVDPADYEEAQQVQSELYSQALGQAEQSETLNATYSNYLTDAATIGKMEGKNAFIRSLENGSSESQAVAESRTETLDYYAGRQKTLLQSWEGKVRSVERIASSADSEANLSIGDVLAVNYTRDTGVGRSSPMHSVSTANVTVELVNGTTVDTLALNGVLDKGTTGDYEIDGLEPSASRSNVLPGGWSGSPTYDNMTVHAPDAEADGGAEPVPMLKGDHFMGTWTEIDTEGVAQANNVENFANSTYSEWEAGAITTEDLVDPYLGAREYDPNETGATWQMRTLTAMGVTPPQNVSNLDRMEIADADKGVTVEGTLMAQADPPGADGYAIGKTYDARNISGHVFVATNDGPHKLEGEFTIESADRIDGDAYGSGEVIRYDRPDYQTADLAAYKNMSEQIMQIRADLEAREQAIEANATSGAGGLFNADDLPFGGWGVAVALVAFIALLLVPRS
ncbi:hypothetical protein [Halorientalis halophila]|uniref:hypothetical protein n=1 Tax=Halorientalis halophila TaxID=3108499 RepID=UPI00300AAFDA